MPHDRFAQLRASLAALAVVGLLATIAVVEGPFVNVRTPPGIAFVLAFWGGPSICTASSRGQELSVVLGVGLAISTPVLMRTVILTDSSTAALDVFPLGVFLWVLVLLGLVVERAVLALSARRRP